MNALGAAAALATAVAFCRLSRLSVAARPRCAVCRAGTCYYKPSSGLQTWPPHLLIIAAVCASCPGCGRLAASQLVVGPGAGDGAWHVWALRAAQPRGDRRRARGRRREAGARGGRAGRRRGPRHHARRLPALRPQGAPLPSLWASRRRRGRMAACRERPWGKHGARGPCGPGRCPHQPRAPCQRMLRRVLRLRPPWLQDMLDQTQDI